MKKKRRRRIDPGKAAGAAEGGRAGPGMTYRRDHEQGTSW